MQFNSIYICYYYNTHDSVCRKDFHKLSNVFTREFDTYESKKHPESPIGLIFFVKFIGYILRDLA